MKLVVPQKCLIIALQGSSPRDHWAEYRVHKAGEAVDHPPMAEGSHLLEPGQSVTFPWCPLQVDEDFQRRFREVTILNDGGEPKETVKVTATEECYRF